MARGWTLAQSFAHFGAKARNHVWGWSATNEDQTTVVLTLWEDLLAHDGSYDVFGQTDLPFWTDALGNRDRIEKLKLARDRCGGLFHVVMVQAKDTSAHPRSIASMHPDDTCMMRLVELDEKTGEFRAVRVRRENA